MTFSYRDRAGARLEVVPRGTPGAFDLRAADSTGRHCVPVKVDAEALEDLVAAMYRAAGRTAPVLINPSDVADDWVRHPGRGAA